MNPKGWLDPSELVESDTRCRSLDEFFFNAHPCKIIRMKDFHWRSPDLNTGSQTIEGPSWNFASTQKKKLLQALVGTYVMNSACKSPNCMKCTKPVARIHKLSFQSETSTWLFLTASQNARCLSAGNRQRSKHTQFVFFFQVDVLSNFVSKHCLRIACSGFTACPHL